MAETHPLPQSPDYCAPADYYYIPAGSLTSRRCSTLNSDTEREECRGGKETEGSDEGVGMVGRGDWEYQGGTPPSPILLSPSHSSVSSDLQLLHTLPNPQSSSPSLLAHFQHLQARGCYCPARLEVLQKGSEKVTKKNEKYTKSLLEGTQEMRKEVLERIGKMSGKLQEVIGGERETVGTEDIHHLLNHLDSQLEILCCRHNRLKAMHEHLSSEHRTLLKDADTLVKTQRKWVETQGTVERLQAIVRTKDALIEKLEDRLSQSRMSGGSTASTVYYSSGRASAEKGLETSPAHRTVAGEQTASPQFAALEGLEPHAPMPHKPRASVTPPHRSKAVSPAVAKDSTQTKRPKKPTRTCKLRRSHVNES